MSVISRARRQLTFRRGVSVVALTAAWCALWGSPSAANILSGPVVSAAATTLGMPARSGGLRLVPLLQLVMLGLVVSTAVVAAEVDVSVIYLHVLHADRRDDVRGAHVRTVRPRRTLTPLPAEPMT